MTKNQLYRSLKQQYTIKKVWFKPYDFLLEQNGVTYQVKVLSVSESTQLTINSKYIWNIQKGKLRGIRFVVRSNNLIQMKDVLMQDNPLILCTNKPYKVLKYINESEVKDISNTNEIYGILFFVSLSKLYIFLNNRS